MKVTGISLLFAVANPAASHLVKGRQDDMRISLSQFAGLPPQQQVCEVLRKSYPNFTSFPNSTAYTADNTDYWTAASSLGPACIFAPNRAQDLGTAILLLRTAKASFAVRGGGHMPIGDFNNIDARGVLLSSSNFKQLSYTANKASVNVGPDNRWQDVYKFISPDNLLVVGGRVGIVGIPGFFLGGGVSFLGNQYGWAVNNLVSLTVVLATGKVVTINSQNQYSDLFWAMKGGGNSFAIITNLELKTYATAGTTIGDVQYGAGEDVKNKWINAVVTNAQNGNQDEKHGVIPLAVKQSLQPEVGITYQASLFYNGDNQAPAVLANFTAPNFPTLTSSFARKSLGDYVQEGAASQPPPGILRQRFYFMSIPASASALLIAHDTFFAKVDQNLNGNVPFYVTAFAAMSMPTSFFQNAINRGGEPMSIQPSGGPQIWIEFSHTYQRPEDEPIIDAYLRDLDSTLRAALTANGTPPNKFIYLNDADKFQNVFAGYPASSVQRLKSIRNKYDPSKVFTTQQPGGWKVDAAR
ncbi:putative FAD dependent oxidoreductase [Elsinoe ampelina]|uniref:Putative FAD dependent oxidoreductase n=1 Tax=Elsinoe ampelina TaxID=302913 RepID=A0A6A6GG88_9PEZI|nr:putative FAD dependent oxidoreductase [Elsinoe ampelina]